MSFSLSPASSPMSSSTSHISHSQAAISKALERIASSKRINRASDDAAGLVIATKLRAELDSMSQASNNLEQGVSVMQTADSALEQTQSLMQKQRNLALQAGNDAVLDTPQRDMLNKQYQELGQEIDRISQNTQYGQNKLLDGSYHDKAIQAGTESGQTINVSITSQVSGQAKGFDQAGLGLSGTSLSNSEEAAAALTKIDRALEEVGQQRGNIGAIQSNSIESARRSLAASYGNLTDSESSISDTDVAKESANLITSQIRAQAGLAMQATSNHLNSAMAKQLLSF